MSLSRSKQLNRAEVVDQNFTATVRAWSGAAKARQRGDGEILCAGTSLTVGAFRELFESQLISRHLDLMG